MIYEACNWYKNIKHKSPLDNFIEERSIDIPSTYCEEDEQIFVTNYIQCVRLDDIEKREPWSPLREESIRKWATPDTLRRLKYIQEEETKRRIIPSNAFHDLPMLSREYKLNTGKQEKFKITDGIHRINRARELCIIDDRTANNCHMDCILASVEEHIKINKNDIQNIEIKNIEVKIK